MAIGTIYCDESGFTGEHLLNRDQRFFGYSTVAVEPDEANELVNRVIRDYRLQGRELKGRNLVRSERGHRAIHAILDAVGPRSQVAVHHKEFAFAGKFFEYAFEPLISDINSLFYSIDFHLFVANMLYLNLVAKHDRALELAKRFEEALRSDDKRLHDFISLHGPNEEDPVEQMISFCVYNRDALLKELAEVKSFGGWTLELTLTSIWSLLGYWGERFDSLRVYCDDSVPLRDEQSTVNIMVGRDDRQYISFRRRRKPLTFNLAEPISLVTSHATPGIQLADVLAASTCMAVEQSDDPRWRKTLHRLFELGVIHDDSIYPDPEYIDLNRRETAVNYVVLLELVQRSADGADLMERMPDFVRAAYTNYPEFQRQQTEGKLIIE